MENSSDISLILLYLIALPMSSLKTSLFFSLKPIASYSTYLGVCLTIKDERKFWLLFGKLGWFAFCPLILDKKAFSSGDAIVQL